MNGQYFRPRIVTDDDRQPLHEIQVVRELRSIGTACWLLFGLHLAIVLTLIIGAMLGW